MQNRLVEMTAYFGVRVHNCGCGPSFDGHVIRRFKQVEHRGEDALSAIEQMGGSERRGDDSRIVRSRSDLIHRN